MKFTSIIVLVFFSSFSASAGTFVETFDDDNLDEWQEIVQLNNAPGSWEIVNNELHAVSHETFIRLLTTGDDAWENYTLEFDVKPLKKHGIGIIAIAARITETWVVYCSIEDRIEIVDGEALPGPRVNCVAGNLHDVIFISLHSKPHALLRLNKWSNLKLTVHQNTTAFSINGKQIIEPTKIPNFKGVLHPDFNEFSDFLMGGVGFGLANYTARFDNITITGESIPNKGGLSVSPQSKLATTWGQLKQF
jgi:hypothetical protein